MAGGWFVLREKYCWLVAGGWFVLREKYCWLVAGGWFVLREKYCWRLISQANRTHISTEAKAVRQTQWDGLYFTR
jgi:hypothetical protein